jgi:hypothetical protein
MIAHEHADGIKQSQSGPVYAFALLLGQHLEADPRHANPSRTARPTADGAAG